MAYEPVFRREYERCIEGGRPGDGLDALLERIADLDFSWGVSDGN